MPKKPNATSASRRALAEPEFRAEFSANAARSRRSTRSSTPRRAARRARAHQSRLARRSARTRRRAAPSDGLRQSRAAHGPRDGQRARRRHQDRPAKPRPSAPHRRVAFDLDLILALRGSCRALAVTSIDRCRHRSPRFHDELPRVLRGKLLVILEAPHRSPTLLHRRRMGKRARHHERQLRDRLTGPGRRHYRLIAFSTTAPSGADDAASTAAIVVLNGLVKPNASLFSDGDYRRRAAAASTIARGCLDVAARTRSVSPIRTAADIGRSLKANPTIRLPVWRHDLRGYDRPTVLISEYKGASSRGHRLSCHWYHRCSLPRRR